MRNISLQLSDNHSNVPGINRNSSSRGSIRISPPIVPNNESKPILRSNSSNMRNDLEMQSFCSSESQTNGLLANKCNDFGNQMFSHHFYDTNNYLSHVNKCQQMSKNGITLSHGAMNMSGHLTQMPTTSVANNGITSAKSISHSRASLEDHGVDVGRLSPSSSSNDSRKSRYSSASLDSGRGSDAKISGQSHRVSVHSCESIGSSSSNKDNYNRNSSSSSSIGSGNSVGHEVEVNSLNSCTTVADNNWTPVSGGHSITGALSIPEMVLHGIADEEIIHSWLSRIHFEEYANNFIRAGYDMPTISRMTPEDLTAIGITKPGKRQILKTEIQRLSIADGIPDFKPNSLLEWLTILRLDQYFNILCAQGYDTIDRVTELAWEDLEEVGIKKLGHQKKIMLAIKRINNLNNNMSRSSSADASKLSLPLVYNNTNMCGEIPTRASPSNYQIPVITQMQDTVPIKMFAPTKSTPSPTSEKPITPQLKTFQQLPTNGYMFCRQRSDGQYFGQLSNEQQNCVFQSSRGRSLESLDNSEGNYYQMYCAKPQQRYPFNGFQKPLSFAENDMTLMRDTDQIHGYETDSEVINSYANNRRHLYEIDGTATLQRPKGLIKNKPIAKIVAKSRQIETNQMNPFSNEPQKVSSFDKRLDSMTQTDNNSLNTYICEDNQTNPYFQDMSSQLYSSLQRKKPPPPPKRVNSIRNNTSNYGTPSMTTFSAPQNSVHREGYEDFQEQVFASCVKNLTSRFSMNNNNSDDLTHKQSNDTIDYSNDFPPPPSPLSFVECQNYNTLQRRKDTSDRECNISSSSSTESMPFANDNIGTILRVNSESIGRDLGSPSHSFTSSANSSMTSSPSSAIPHKMISQDISNKILDSEFVKTLSPTKQSNDRTSFANQSAVGMSVRSSAPIDQLDDIETMLVNLSEQLDLMLENENHKKRNN